MSYLIKRMSLLLALFMGGTAFLWAQDTIIGNVTGTVMDATGMPLQHVTVKLSETNASAITGTDGSFSLYIPTKEALIECSYIGYQSKQVIVKNNEPLVIVLQKEDKSLDEVIIVGYGTQKKANLTGAVEQIDGEVLKNRPLTNLSQGLQGMIPNLNLNPADGRPGTSPTFNVRGLTSIGQGGSALVLIDGVEGNPALLNPQDVASVTVLKDAASSAIYGARGAFGVVLITTKNPEKDKMQLSYSSNYAVKTPTYIPDFVTDGYTWASMFNESFSSWNNYASYPQNVNKTLRFSQEYLQELKRRSEDPSLSKVEIDPATGQYIYYDSHDWTKDLYKKNTLSIDQGLSVSGKSNKTSYLFSAHYFNQPGLFRYNSDDYKMYNIRSKGSIEVFPWLTVSNNTDFSKVLSHIPMNVGETGGIWRNMVAEGHPMAPLFNPDGSLTFSAAYTVGDYWYGKNGMDYDRNIFRNTVGFSSSFFNNAWRIKGDFTYQVTNNNETRIRVPVPYSRIPGVIEYLGNAYNDIREINRNTQYMATNVYTEYEKRFKKHYIKAMAGYNYELSTYKRIGAERNGLIYEDAQDLNLALGESIITTGGYEQWNILGGFSRLNYSYDDRYLLELNGRYDGSSKFPADERYAFFPSVSAGWRLTKEPYWQISKNLISDLKLRASYGSLGNGNINSYIFREQLSLAQMTRILEGTQNAYTNAPPVLPEGLTWETATTANYGLDLALLNNKVLVNVDYYHRKTSNMFTQGPELPAVFGASSPRGNYADLMTRGFELSVSFRDHFNAGGKPFNYTVRAILSDNKSKILKYNNARKLLNDYYVGQTVGEIWGYVTDGFFVSEDHIRTSANQSLFLSTASGVWRTGDIKFKDLNNDGVINYGDNTVGNPGDRVVIGNESPRYRFGLNLSADWNQFFFSAFVQGVGRQDWYPSRGSNTFWGQYNVPYGHPLVSQLGHIWTEEHPDAYFPRYTGYLAWTAGGTLREAQTRYLQNAAYARLKSIQLGYSLPTGWLNRVKANAATIYVSGENLFTWSPMFRVTAHNIDPENTGDSDQILGDSNQGDGFNYPMLRSVSIGLSITF
ncbi:SusC/RagA family TonB-linked outer membrane protein [Niabella sp. CJ426]|uniref:SusC/RagA family TonB-linked outer membrane protein n=1 Tax=Niabella sp. CJ426 TaxID=3393740 RepID=UPI003D030912